MRDSLIIAGSRSLNPSIAQISALITTLPDLVICGCADGVDKAGYTWARNWNIPVEFFPAWIPQRDWALSVRMDKEVVHACPRISNRGAGNVRNGEICFQASRAVIIHSGTTPGSLNMLDHARRKGIPIVNHIWRPKGEA